jgi:hypothetical protein
MKEKGQFFKSDSQESEIKISEGPDSMMVLEIPQRMRELEQALGELVDLNQKMQNVMDKMIQAQLLQVKIQMELILDDVRSNPDRYENRDVLLDQIRKDMMELFK